MRDADMKTENPLPFTGSIDRKGMLAELHAYRVAEKLDIGAFWSAERGQGMEVAIKRLAPELSPCGEADLGFEGCGSRGSDIYRDICTNVIGIAPALVRLETAIFWGVDPLAAVQWPEAFIGALQGGVDPEPGLVRWLWWLCSVRSPGADYGDAAAAAEVGNLYLRTLRGEDVTAAEWGEAMRLAAAGGAWHAWHAGRYTVERAALGVLAPDAPADAARWIAGEILARADGNDEAASVAADRQRALAWLEVSRHLVVFLRTSDAPLDEALADFQDDED